MPKWAAEYIDYRALKKLLSAGGDESAFMTALTAEIAKVNTHAASVEAALRGRMAKMVSLRRSAAPYEVTLTATHELYAATEELQSYCELCYTAVYKICKKYDKQRAQRVSPLILAHLEKEPFMRRLLSTPSIVGSAGGELLAAEVADAEVEAEEAEAAAAAAAAAAAVAVEDAAAILEEPLEGPQAPVSLSTPARTPADPSIITAPNASTAGMVLPASRSGSDGGGGFAAVGKAASSSSSSGASSSFAATLFSWLGGSNGRQGRDPKKYDEDAALVGVGSSGVSGVGGGGGHDSSSQDEPDEDDDDEYDDAADGHGGGGIGGALEYSCEGL